MKRNSKQREERIRQKRLARQRWERQNQKAERSAELNRLNENHPCVILARHIAPTQAGWCWRGKKVRGVTVARPVDFFTMKHCKELLNWISLQPWYNGEIPEALRGRYPVQTWHDYVSWLMSCLAEKQTTQFVFMRGIVTLTLHAIQPAPAPATTAA